MSGSLQCGGRSELATSAETAIEEARTDGSTTDSLGDESLIQASRRNRARVADGPRASRATEHPVFQGVEGVEPKLEKLNIKDARAKSEKSCRW